ncbi:hypothetical protein [Micromonospora sp. IBHARD004]|uniref:hypothetical protein n=1 Tax=Micromonospora sp. IBHARD004 TaxID=3457764 RepID=UPI004058004E
MTVLLDPRGGLCNLGGTIDASHHAETCHGITVAGPVYVGVLHVVDEGQVHAD